MGFLKKLFKKGAKKVKNYVKKRTKKPSSKKHRVVTAKPKSVNAPKSVAVKGHRANNINAAENIKKQLQQEGRKGVTIKKQSDGKYVVTSGRKAKTQSGSWSTPSGKKPKSGFTPRENRVIKKYRDSGNNWHSLSASEKTTLSKARNGGYPINLHSG
jgi:hypothetical protein